MALANLPVTWKSIEDLATPCSYGAAWGDINNDGFLDLGIATCKNSSGSSLAKNIFYRNLGNGNNWLKIKPVGTEANRSAIGGESVCQGKYKWRGNHTDAGDKLPIGLLRAEQLVCTFWFRRCNNGGKRLG